MKFLIKIIFLQVFIFHAVYMNGQVVLSTATGTNFFGNYLMPSGTTPPTQVGPCSISFVIENTTATPYVLTNVSCHLGPVELVNAGTPVTTKLFYSSTSLSGTYVLSGPTWTQIATGSAVVPDPVAVTPVISGISFTIPAFTQYRFAIEASTGLRFSGGTPVPTPNVFSSSGLNLKVGNALIAGQNVGSVGVSPNAPFNPYFFGGSVTLIPPCSGAPNPGNTLSSTGAPASPCEMFTLSLQNNPAVSGLTYQWQYRNSAAGVPSYTNISGATSATLNTAFFLTNANINSLVGSTTFYRCNVTCSGNTVASNEIGLVNNITYYKFIGSGAWTTASNWQCNVLPSEPINVLVDIVGTGAATKTNLNIGPSGVVQIYSDKVLQVNGTLTNAGQIIGSGFLEMSAGSSSMNNTGTISALMYLNGDVMTLQNNFTTAGSMTFLNNSKIILGNFNLDVNTNDLNNTNSNNFIVTNGTGRLHRSVGSIPVLFPVGINTSSYTPATMVNTGATDNFGVRVESGASPTGRTSDVITNSVMRTWRITESSLGGSNAQLTLAWNGVDEPAGGTFDRTQSYIAQFVVCPPPPPPNCSTGYYDAFGRSAALGTNPYTQTRSNLTNFDNRAFIVTSQTVVYTFINTYGSTPGDGNWNNPLNWTNTTVPPSIITAGMEVIINPVSGECNFSGPLNILPGGKLTIAPGKKLNVTQ